MLKHGGDDWLWKPLLYGNILDINFIKRLKTNFKTLEEFLKENDLKYGVGLKRKDGERSFDSSSLYGKPFLDTDKKEFRRYHVNPSGFWTEANAAAIPQKRFKQLSNII